MGKWTLDDVPWHSFDPSKVDPQIVKIAKAASLVEFNAPDYVTYLSNVFPDDEAFKRAAEEWGREEIQHGEALARWAKAADATFDFDAAFRKFTDGYKLTLDVAASIRGSRTGELIARCIVETGTSSFYTALAEAAEEPVLRFICRKIAADEHRHYKLFYKSIDKYMRQEKLSLWKKLRIAFGRVAEAEDDELAYAYYSANGGDRLYDRKRWSRAYASRAYAIYHRHHIERGMSMIFKAVGLNPAGRLNGAVSSIAWKIMQFQSRRLAAYRNPAEI